MDAELSHMDAGEQVEALDFRFWILDLEMRFEMK
jgi:hypothetical protein